MYLLMLLATFISAIYGYNLSPRADYDRDVPHKKAASIIFRFLFQDDTAGSLLGRINRGVYSAEGEYNLQWTLPGDIVYADYSSTEIAPKQRTTTLFFKQNAGDTEKKIFYMRSADNQNGQAGDASDYKEKYAANYLVSGRRFFDGKMMVSKVVCTDIEMYEDNVKQCTPQTEEMLDSNGNPVQAITGTCCNQGRNYLVSYRRMDSRWLNRVHLGISLDFLSAVAERNYTDNVGVINWDGHNWKFRGKINFPPVYARDMIAWEEEHADDNGETHYYPDAYRNRSVWTLPNTLFTEDFFKDMNGRNICENGCLFHIRTF